MMPPDRAEEAARSGSALHGSPAHAQLLETLLHVAIEVDAPEKALEEGLALVCAYGGWNLGHAVVLATESCGRFSAATLWHAPHPQRYAQFMRLADTFDYARGHCGFLGHAMKADSPVWLADAPAAVGGSRAGALRAAGLRSAFAFPVSAGGEILAVLEFYSERERAADTLLLASMRRLARCFAIIVERQRAASVNARLAAIVDGANDAIIGRNLDGVITSWNPAAERLLGYTAAEAIGGPATMILLPEDHAAVARATERLRRGEVLAPREGVRVDKAGRLVHVSVSVSPMRGRSGKVYGAAVILRDVNEVVRTRQRLRAILESEPACVKVVDAQGNPLEMNRAGLEFLDAASIEEVRAHGLIRMIASEHRPRFLDALRRTLAGESCDLEFEIVGLHGSRRWVESHTAPFRPDDNEPVAMLAVTRDITDRRRAEARVEHLVNHDALTGLPNRNLFRDRLATAIVRARRRAEMVGVIAIDLDRFHKVNESLGFDVGDELLRLVAARLAASLREVDTLARLGGDQFALLAEGLGAPDEMRPIVTKTESALAAPFRLLGKDVFVNASMGVALYPPHAEMPQALLECAELAMSHVKQDGGGGYHYSEGLNRTLRAGELGIEAALRGALEAGELAVWYQPKVEFGTRRVCGAEALLRWNSASLGPIGPATFIPIAEETGLIVPIGAWALRQACTAAAAWRDGALLSVSVNLSPRQFRQKDLVQLVVSALAESGLAPHRLELEITEGTAMSNPEHAARVLGELHAVGVKLSVDDFGTGYSSLNYLHQFPLHGLKIDRSFVQHLCTSSSSEAIVAATIALGHSLGLWVVAEGVETVEQQAALARLGCDFGQGFLYGAARAVARGADLLI